ncbi:MAG: UDP-2,3-diacylglucosamine diphosphatase [Hydrogenophaga sp.]
MPARFAQWRAPAHWRAVDCVSDLHLQAGEPATFEAWRRWLNRPPAERADALIILGDLFEVWIGDDALHGDGPDAVFWRACADTLRAHSHATPVFFMAGNRDFLLGQDGLQACGMQALQDPTVLSMAGRRWVLSHGDTLCLDDTDYQRFRARVRSAEWQHDFLAQPLSQRQAMARELRQQSEARKRQQGQDPSLWADVDAAAARAWLQAVGADTLVHGHTHRPAEHDLGEGLQRVVLGDWDVVATPPRGDILRLSARGIERLRLPGL